MNLKNYIQFGEVLENHGLENKFSVSESLAIAEDISLMENAPQRITDKLSEIYEGVEFDMEKLIGDIKESFKDVFESEHDNDEDNDDDDETYESDGMDNAFNILLSEAASEALMLIAEEEDEEDDEEEVQEGARPKRLTGAAKKQRDAKAHLMKIMKKDPEIKSYIERAKAKIIKMAKMKGKKEGIKVQRINFDKIKL